MTFAISPAGLALIQDFEGFRAEPAQLPDGNWVVGYGHVRVGEPGAPVTEEEAAGLLTIDLAPVERLVNAHVTARLTQAQFDALVSFAVSVGAEAFVQSQVLRRVNNAEHVAAACAMDAWRKSDVGGELEVVDALVRRRAAEKAHYLKDVAVETSPSVFLRAKLDYAASVLGAPIAYAPARAVGSVPVQQAAPEAAHRLTEILASEPQTELLLTQVVAPEAFEEAEEIVTAHAKPAARKIAPFTPSLPRDRRISRMRKRAALMAIPGKIANHFNLSHSVEVVGLAALMLFGLGLTLIGASMLYGGEGDAVQVAGAAAFALPGLCAVLLAGFGLFRPSGKVAVAEV